MLEQQANLQYDHYAFQEEKFMVKISNNQIYCYEKTRKDTTGKLNSNSFAEKMEVIKADNSKVAESIKQKAADMKQKQDTYIRNNNVDLYDIGIYGKEDMGSQLEFPIETQRYKIELCNEVEGVPAYLIQDKKFGKELYIRESELVIQKDAGTGMEFMIRDMNQPLFMNIHVTDELKCILQEIGTKRNIEIPEMPMQGGVYVNKDTKTGLQYLAIKGNEGKGASIIITSEKDMEIFNNLTSEFQQYSVCEDEQMARAHAIMEISGNLRRGAEGFISLTSNEIMYTSYDGNPKKTWCIHMSKEYYSTAKESLALGMDFEILDEWLKILGEADVKNGEVEVFDQDYFGSMGESYYYK